MERRYGARVATGVGVSCRVPASPERATLLDLSRSGCRLEFGRHNIDRGATVNLDFRSGKSFGGEVVWTAGALAGVRFHSSLPRPVAIDLGLEPREPQEEAFEPDSTPCPAQAQDAVHHWIRHTKRR